MGAAFAQALVNGVITGSMIAIPAVGFTTIFAVLRYLSFAVAAYITVGAFAGWYVNYYLGGGLVPMLLAAAIVSAAVGVVVEQGALSSLRAGGPLTVTIGSIAANLVIENIIRFFIGNDLKGFDLPLLPDMRLGDLRMGAQQIENLAIAIILMTAVFAFLRYTRFGRAMRAVADNPDLARLKRIDPRRVATVAVALGAGLAGLGGVLLGADTSIDPLAGYRILLSVFAAAVLGGLGSVPGAVLGALTIGIAEEVALLGIPPTYRDGVGFLAILLMLTFRPRGLLGERAV